MKRRLFSHGARPLPTARSRGSCAKISHAVFAAAVAVAITRIASAQIASLDKGDQILVNRGLQIWGLDTGASSFTYNNLTNANMNAVVWSYGESKPQVLSTGQEWGLWVNYAGSPSSALNSTEQAHYADLVAIQVGDEQEPDLESANGATEAWFNAAHAGNYFTDKLLYVNSTYVNDVNAFFSFIADANPDAISWDAYPFGTTGVYPYNWLGKAQIYRRLALGSYINAGSTAPRPYGLYLQTYAASDGARFPGDLEMRWQMFTAWTLGYKFVDAFTVGGSTSLFNGGNMSSPSEPRYTQFKESARQSMNLGPALTKLISFGYGPNIVRGKDPSGNLNPVPIDWPVFSPANAPLNQQYLTGVSAVNLGTKNNGQPGDVYVGFFNPLLTSYGDPAGEAYFMVTNALGAYLQDPSLLVTDCIQQITLNFDFGASGITSLQRLSRETGQVEVVSLAHVSGSLYNLVFNLDGGTGDLFKYNDGTPFVGIEAAINALYWDNDGASAGNNISNGSGLGGSGTWDTSASKWFNGATNGIWTANKAAVFWGTAGTVTLAAPQSANSLEFKTNGYTLTGSTLTMSGSAVDVDSGVTATISSTLAGSVGVNKTGPGTLVLANTSNSYTGGTTVTSGVVRVSADGNLGPAPASLATNITLNGGTLQFGANFDIANTRGISLGTAGGTIDTQGFTNPSGYNATAGGFTGPGDLTKLGTGTFFAAATTGGANTTWKGKLIIKEGTWKIVATDGLPYNPADTDPLQPGQVTLDGGTWQMGTAVSASDPRRGVTIAGGGGTVDTQNFSLTWAGPWAGSVTSAVLNKIGSGSLNLNSTASFGPSTYAGNLNVNEGTLQLDGGTAMGDLAAINLANTSGVNLNITAASETIGSLSGGGASGGNVSISASLIAGGNNKTTTFGGVISGAGSLTKAGTGTMTLTAANNYSGGTIVSGGTLRVSSPSGSGSGTGTGAVTVNGGTLGGTGTISGPITVNSGGHLAPGASAGTLFTSSNTILSSGAALDYDLANVTTVGSDINDLLAITGGLTLGSSITLNINAYQGDITNGTYKLVTYTGSLSGTTSGWTVGSSNGSGSHGYSFSTATPGEILLNVFAATPTWTGAISTSWDTSGNWQTSVEPASTADVVFPTPIPATGATINLTTGEVAKTLTINDNYTLTGGDLNVAAGTISVASGKTATVGSVLAGSSAITKSGSGTLVVSGTNTYSGGTNINAGTLRVAADTNLGNGGGVTFGGGTLNATASFSSSRAVSVGSSGGTIDNAGAVSTTLTGTISGAAGNTLTKTGSGTLVLGETTPRSGTSSTWLGNIAVTGGTLKVGNGGSTGFLPGYDPIAYAGLPPTVPTISLASGTTLEFNHGAGGATQDAANAVVITGAGNVVISGAKTETFVANNDYTGSTTINSVSSLRIGWGGASNTGGLGATAVANSGLLTFSNDHNTTFPGSISGTGALVKEFAGTLTITGSAAHTGGTTINSGTLQVGGGGTTGSISGNIANNANLAFNRSDNLTFSGVVSGPGAVAQRGTGTLVLSGANTYSGGTTVSAGVLQVDSNSNLGTAPSSLATNITLDGGTLKFGGAFNIDSRRGINMGAAGGTIDTNGIDTTYSPTNGFRGGDLTKTGTGTFYASATTAGSNTLWTGKLILKQGIWKIQASDGLPINPNQAAANGNYYPEQVTFDGGTLQINSNLSISADRRGITIQAGGGTIDTQTSSFTWAGTVAGNSTTGSPSATWTKIGSGQLQLSTSSVSASSYTPYAGNFNINAGPVVFNGGGAMGDLASVNLANTAGVNLTITGATETIGSLSGGGASGGNVSLTTGLVTGANNSTTSFDGIVSGGGGLTKTGTGTMTLTGANTYGGGTIVSGGTLRVNNTAGSGTGSGPVSVNAGAVLGGTGTIQANVTNSGTLAPGTSPGTLHLGGTYNQAAGGRLEIELASTASHDELAVTGSATLAGTLSVSLLGGFVPHEDDLFQIMTAATFGGSKFTSTSLPGLPGDLVWNVNYGATAVTLAVVLPGDFNHSGAVDAADYVAWRKGGGTFTPSDYNTWRTHFGETASSGASLTAVPEPAAWLLLSVGCLMLLTRLGLLSSRARI